MLVVEDRHHSGLGIPRVGARAGYALSMVPASLGDPVPTRRKAGEGLGPAFGSVESNHRVNSEGSYGCGVGYVERVQERSISFSVVSTDVVIGTVGHTDFLDPTRTGAQK